MKVLIIGGAGMVGRKLAERLVRDGSLGAKPITALTLYDVVPPAAPDGAAVTSAECPGAAYVPFLAAHVPPFATCDAVTADVRRRYPGEDDDGETPGGDAG